VAPTSDLVAAQPITFETMRIAAAYAKDSVSIAQYAVQYHDEERIPVPGSFKRTPDLNRSVGDIKRFKKKRKLALIKDIMDTLYKADTTADYFIYTNVDIALQPYFYKVVADIIEEGNDAFIINRRTIPGHYKHISEIPMMYAELGEKHPGWDCFVFKRNVYPSFKLGDVCIGTGWIGRTMIINMACLAKAFKVFTDQHLTFHIGDDRTWKSDPYQDYLQNNIDEGKRILQEFEKTHGPLDRNQLPGLFFRHLEKMEAQKKAASAR